jgi:hypothetical protein
MRFTFVLVTKYYLDHNLKEIYTEGATSIGNKKFIQKFDEGT